MIQLPLIQDLGVGPINPNTVCTVCVEEKEKRLIATICLDSVLWKSDLDQDNTFNPEFMETSSLLA